MNGTNPLLEALSGSWLSLRPAGGGVREANGLLGPRVELVVLVLDDGPLSIASKSKASDWESEIFCIYFLLNEID